MHGVRAWIDDDGGIEGGDDGWRDMIGWIMALQEHWKPEGTSLPQ